MLNRLDQISAEISIQMAKYKDAYRKSKIAEGFDRELYQREMDKATKRLCELLAEKRKLRGLCDDGGNRVPGMSQKSRH